MIIPVVKSTASLLTIVAGHFLNRQFDHGVLVFFSIRCERFRYSLRDVLPGCACDRYSLTQRCYLPNDFLESIDSIESKKTIAWFENEQKISAVKILIKENRYPPAKKLLDGVYASQGKCNATTIYFNRARDEGGSLCVTSEYLQGCR